MKEQGESLQTYTRRSKILLRKPTDFVIFFYETLSRASSSRTCIIEMIVNGSACVYSNLQIHNTSDFVYTDRQLLKDFLKMKGVDDKGGSLP